MSRPWYAVVVAIGLGALATSACKKSAPAMSAPPGDAAGAGADAASDDLMGEAEAEPEQPRSIDELSDDLDRLTDELEGLRADAPMPEATSEEERCDRICAIAEATCDLSDQICDLAGAHDGETRYADACDRAGGQCTDATDACSVCRG